MGSAFQVGCLGLYFGRVCSYTICQKTVSARWFKRKWLMADRIGKMNSTCLMLGLHEGHLLKNHLSMINFINETSPPGATANDFLVKDSFSRVLVVRWEFGGLSPCMKTASCFVHGRAGGDCYIESCPLSPIYQHLRTTLNKSNWHWWCHDMTSCHNPDQMTGILSNLTLFLLLIESSNRVHQEKAKTILPPSIEDDNSRAQTHLCRACKEFSWPINSLQNRRLCISPFVWVAFVFNCFWRLANCVRWAWRENN